jgi:transcriptional regulator with XRE-family HTH domain
MPIGVFRCAVMARAALFHPWRCNERGCAVGARNLKRRKLVQLKHRDIVSRFAGKLKAVREERKVSQRQLASLAQIHPSYLTRLEAGRSAAGIDLVEKLATALGVTLADLLPTERVDRSHALKREVRSKTEAIMADAEEGDLALLSSLLSVFQRGLSRRR